MSRPFATSPPQKVQSESEEDRILDFKRLLDFRILRQPNNPDVPQIRLELVKLLLGGMELRLFLFQLDFLQVIALEF